MKEDITENESPADTEGQKNSETIREISYVVLFFSGVFIVSAMETGSYRTPWPVAAITALTGLALFGYSRYLQSKE